ncbi:adenosine-specific kinase [Caldiplasma sukawensis]
MEIKEIEIRKDSETNVILGHSHFIKTVEDLDEIIKTHIPRARYSISFSEASGPRLIRYEGNDPELVNLSIENIKNIGAGHTFLIMLKDAFPISILNQIKMCQEVTRIYAATANPLTVIVYTGSQGNGIVGVIDGASPLAVEDEKGKRERYDLLRKIGYKR